MEVKRDSVALVGIERVAILLLALGDEQVQKLFKLMDDAEIREIAMAMANLGKVSSSVVEITFGDFVKQLSMTGALVGSLDSTKRLLSKALSKEKMDSLLEEISGPAGRTMWDKLSNVNEVMLASYLKNEYPQTIAVVMTRIKPEHASKVMALFPDNLAMEVIMRMLRMENVRREILDDIEKTLRAEFTTNISKSARKDPYGMVAEIFNSMDRQTETKFLSSLEDCNPDVAERIKSLMFTFDDISKLDSTAIQAIIRAADKSKLALALKGANETIKELFFKGMSERAAKLLKEDMAAMGMVRVRDVDEAQAYMVVTTKELANRGEVLLRNGEEDQEELIG